jgi:hypothetical protein
VRNSAKRRLPLPALSPDSFLTPSLSSESFRASRSSFRTPARYELPVAGWPGSGLVKSGMAPHRVHVSASYETRIRSAAARLEESGRRMGRAAAAELLWGS